eukprot:SAG31_NODE_2149_length_6331_cov_3.422657_2_plen_1496_part_00
MGIQFSGLLVYVAVVWALWRTAQANNLPVEMFAAANDKKYGSSAASMEQDLLLSHAQSRSRARTSVRRHLQTTVGWFCESTYPHCESNLVRFPLFTNSCGACWCGGGEWDSCGEFGRVIEGHDLYGPRYGPVSLHGGEFRSLGMAITFHNATASIFDTSFIGNMGTCINMHMQSTVSFEACQFLSNQARWGEGWGGGGAVRITEQSTASFEACTFSANQANPIPIWAYSTNLEPRTSGENTLQAVVAGLIDEGRTRRNHGGAVYITEQSTVSFAACSFSANQATAVPIEGATTNQETTPGHAGRGGAVYITDQSTVSFEACPFSANQASANGAYGTYGGAVFIGGQSTVSFEACSFFANELTTNLTTNSYPPAFGGAVYITEQSTVSFAACSFSANEIVLAAGTGYSPFGTHIYVDTPAWFFMYNTTFDPFEPGTPTSVFLNVLAGCEQYPCDPGHACSYTNYSLLCTPCPAALVSTDGLLCAPCTAGQGPNANKSACEACGGTNYSISGTCERCAAPNIAENNFRTCRGCAAGEAPNTDRTACLSCPPGHFSAFGARCETCAVPNIVDNGKTTCAACAPSNEPNQNHSACVPCGRGNVSTFGARCVPCVPPRVANGDRTACILCPSGQTGVDGACHCDVGHYNTSLGRIFCLGGDEPSMGDQCSPCGDCVDCGQLGADPVLLVGFVRPVGLPSGVADLDGLIMKCEGDSNTSCHQSNATAVGEPSCLDTYAGYLCKSCISDDYFMQDGACVECSGGLLVKTLALTAILLLLGTGAAAFIKRKTQHFGDAEQQALVAMAKSLWQPLRIMITYAQITSQMDAVLQVRFPPAFTAIMEQLRVVDVLGSLVGTECFSLGGFRSKWLTSVVFQPIAMAGIVAAIYGWSVSKPGEHAKKQARQDLYGNVFFVLFLCYPALVRLSLAAWQCSPSLSAEAELTILLADDRVSCEDWDHDIIQYLSLLLIVVVAIGMPIGFAAQLWRAYRALPAPDEAGLERLKTAADELGLSGVDEAVALFRNVCIGANFGALVDTYKPELYWWESVDMIRKLCLVGLPLLFRGFKLLQAVIVTLFTVAFSVLQSESRPYKMPLDNTLRVCTEQHLVVLAAVAGALLGGDDGALRTKKSRKSADGDGWGLDTEGVMYDLILITSFAVMVVAPLLITLLAKVVTVQRAMSMELLLSNESVEQFEKLTKVFLRLVPFLEAIGIFGGEELQWNRVEAGQQLIAGTGVRMARARFEIGLCGVVDKQRLKNYLSVADATKVDSLSIAQLQDLLIAHYRQPGAYSREDRDLFVTTVQDLHDRAELLEVCQSEGLDITAAFAPAAPASRTPTASVVVGDQEFDKVGIEEPTDGLVRRADPPPFPAHRSEPKRATATTNNPLAAGPALNQDYSPFEVETPAMVRRGGAPSLPAQHLRPPPRLGTPPTLPSLASLGQQLEPSPRLGAPPTLPRVKSIWQEVYSDEHGRAYWHNTITNETRWTDPALDQPQLGQQDGSISDL